MPQYAVLFIAAGVSFILAFMLAVRATQLDRYADRSATVETDLRFRSRAGLYDIFSSTLFLNTFILVVVATTMVFA